jgi:hypothetical protein
VLELLWEKGHPAFQRQRRGWTKLLQRDGVQRLIAQARHAAQGRANAGAVEKALGYFERNVERMQYGTFRKKGYFIGSGVVEAGCKSLVGARCKQSGMFWSVEGAEKILALRCIHHSRNLSAFWKDRLNHHAAANDALALAA